MMFYYLIFFLLILLLVFNEKLTAHAKKQAFYFMGIILILFAGLRAPDIDKDYINYFHNFQQISSFKDIFSSWSKIIEPSFIILTVIFKSIHFNFPVLIFIYALLGVFLKMKGIYKISEYPFLSLLIYFSTLFLIQDMTQIRVSIACGFIFLSFIYVKEKKILKFLFFILVATFFHYSAIIFVITYFLNPSRINKQFYILLISIPIVLILLNYSFIHIVTKFDIGLYSQKIQTYVRVQYWLKEKLNLFNLTIMFQIITAVFFIFYSEQINNYYVILFTKLFCIGISFFYIFSFAPTVAFRLTELLTSVQVFLLPLIIKVIKPKHISELILIIISILLFVNQLEIQGLLKPYRLIFFS